MCWSEPNDHRQNGIRGRHRLRLKNWRGLHLAHGGELFEEAAVEIDRLRLELSVQKACTVAGREEIDRLREAIRRLADQDATLSVQDGGVTVTLDATLTAKERKAVAFAADHFGSFKNQAATLRKLLERLS